MNLTQKLLGVIEDISDEKLHQIINFAESLKQEELRENKSLIDLLVNEYDEALKELAK